MKDEGGSAVMGQLAQLDPIVQSIPGDLSYLHGPSGPYGRITMSGSIAPYPDAESIRSALDGYGDPYARGRAASNLAAVYTCRGQLEDALQASKESLAALYGVLEDPMNYGLEDRALQGLVRAHYNASLILYRAGDANHESARVQRGFAIDRLTEMKHRDEKWQFLNAAIESLTTGEKPRSIPPSAEERTQLQLVEASLRDRASHHTNTICFPATDPPEIEVLVHASLLHDFIAVEVDQEIVAILPAEARKRLDFMAAGLEKAEGYTYTLEIPFVGGAYGATSGDAVTLRGSSIFNSIALDDARNRTFAGFGPDSGTGSLLLRSLLASEAIAEPKPHAEALRDQRAAGSEAPPMRGSSPSGTPAVPHDEAREARQAAQSAAKGGCYVATAVYGSYDCPEVRVLRRWRDSQLASTTAGRQVIRVYYGISPMVVRTLGNQAWFTAVIRRPLDHFVGHLEESGYSSLPYADCQPAPPLSPKQQQPDAPTAS